MKPHSLARLLLFLVGFYDGVIGISFLFFAPAAFIFFGIPAPGHWGYVHFASALLLIFALMFFAASVRPVGNSNLIAYGMLLKIAYVGIALYHWANDGIPFIFQVFILVDTICFFALTWIFYAVIPRPVSPTKS